MMTKQRQVQWQDMHGMLKRVAVVVVALPVPEGRNAGVGWHGMCLYGIRGEKHSLQQLNNCCQAAAAWCGLFLWPAHACGLGHPDLSLSRMFCISSALQIRLQTLGSSAAPHYVWELSSAAGCFSLDSGMQGRFRQGLGRTCQQGSRQTHAGIQHTKA